MYLWSTSAWTMLREVAAHSEEVSGLVGLVGAAMTNNMLLISSSFDCCIRVWGRDGRSYGRTMRGHTQGISAIAASRGTLDLVVSAGLDRQVCRSTSEHITAQHSTRA